MLNKVSILLPVFNAQRYLETAINSVLCQTYQNWELLIGDNHSEDGTQDIAMKFAGQDKRIIYFRNEKNLGVVQNYNQCITRSTGEFIELFGSDDIFHPDCLEKFVRILQDNTDIVLVTSARQLIDEHGQCISIDRPFSETRRIAAQEVIESTMGTLTNWINAPVMFRSKHSGSGFDLNMKLYADIDYWLKIVQFGDAMYLNDALFSYRVHAGSEGSNLLRGFDYLTDVMRLADKYSPYIIGENSSPDALRKFIANHLTKLTEYAIYHKNLDSSSASLLAPLSAEQVKERLPNSTKEVSDEEAQNLVRETHDLKRVASLILVHSVELKEKVERLEAEMRNKQDSLQQQIIKIAQLTQQRDSLVLAQEKRMEEKAMLQKSVDALEKQIETLLSSHSWKLTAPLRNATTFLKGSSGTH